MANHRACVLQTVIPLDLYERNSNQTHWLNLKALLEDELLYNLKGHRALNVKKVLTAMKHHEAINIKRQLFSICAI